MEIGLYFILVVMVFFDEKSKSAGLSEGM